VRVLAGDSMQATEQLYQIYEMTLETGLWTDAGLSGH
jgi:hypothetical protein